MGESKALEVLDEVEQIAEDMDEANPCPQDLLCHLGTLGSI